jgi:serine-type D-Ala-D-Ala carboxypeptidase (penicillin-binding protein 5/6)
MKGSSVMGLQPGDRFRLRDLLYGLMLPSGNDAALAIARHVSGSDAAFVAEMNALMQRLGLTGTTFVDAHGLGGGGLDAYYSARPQLAAAAAEEGIEHRATAYDLAMLARYAMHIPEIEQVARARQWKASGTRTIEMYTNNTFLLRYQGADGLKVGFTEAAGRAIAASASRDGDRVIVVLLDAPARDQDARRLLDWAFDAHCWPGRPGCSTPLTVAAVEPAPAVQPAEPAVQPAAPARIRAARLLEP